MDHWRPGLHSLYRVEDSWQFFVLNIYQDERFFSDIWINSRHGSNLLANKPHFIPLKVSHYR